MIDFARMPARLTPCAESERALERKHAELLAQLQDAALPGYLMRVRYGPRSLLTIKVAAPDDAMRSNSPEPVAEGAATPT